MDLRQKVTRRNSLLPGRFFSREELFVLRAVLTLVAIISALATANGQDRNDWQSLRQLQAGDRIRLSLKTGSVEGAFENWTPEQVTAGNVSARKEDILKIERYSGDAWGRGKKAAVGALIGFGAGFALGAATTRCRQNQLGPCYSRGEGGAFVGGAFAIIGAGIGALLPSHTRSLIYSVN